MKNHIKIIDLFAGPGGLGEGFSAYKDTSGKHPFKIALSIEKEVSAHQTLQLRAFYRQFPEGNAPKIYYDFLAGKLGNRPDAIYSDKRYIKESQAAKTEARQLTLGEQAREINKSIEDALGTNCAPWILIGGPPCQAYSLVGRSRNRSKVGYRAEDDHRNFLYKEYLKVIAKFQPPVFVMENVKGMLSAKVGEVRIFDEIRRDLECPARALGNNHKRQDYVIFSLTSSTPRSNDLFGREIDPQDFVIKSEYHGVPQARHRVILLGVRSDLAAKIIPRTLELSHAPTIRDIINGLPPLRSGLSKEEDTLDNWKNSIERGIPDILKAVNRHGLYDVANVMESALQRIRACDLGRGANWSSNPYRHLPKKVSSKLRSWYADPSGWEGVCNHETRKHITSDLHRYLFCASYSEARTGEERQIPKAKDFPAALTPAHANWKSGHFVDRFRVQAANRAATTVTSHISKDGHYFIHYDPAQCRSLTVREAARIQTFPDNYFFVGNRTQQYVQVGNAVPPFLATQIAAIVEEIICR